MYFSRVLEIDASIGANRLLVSGIHIFISSPHRLVLDGE